MRLHMGAKLGAKRLTKTTHGLTRRWKANMNIVRPSEHARLAGNENEANYKTRMIEEALASQMSTAELPHMAWQNASRQVQFNLVRPIDP